MAEVTADKLAARSRPRRAAGVRFIAGQAGRTRNRKVIEAGDMPQRKWQVHGWFAVRRKKRAVLRRMLIHPHVYVERLLDRRHGAFNIHQMTILGKLSHGQTVLLGKAYDGVVVLLSWTKTLGEFLNRQVVTIGRTVWIADLFDQSL